MNPDTTPSSPAGFTGECSLLTAMTDVIAVEGALTVASAEGWRSRIAEALEQGATCGVDLGAASEIDVFGLQLLYAARRSAEGQGKIFRVLNAGQIVHRACIATGIDPAVLGLDVSLVKP